MFVATGIGMSALAREGRKVVRKAGKQVLLLSRDDRVFALANRCPHEGFPLSEGTEGPGCVLTCNWHNWKFDLETGKALIGRDPVRIYPTEIRSGEIFVDLSDPPAAEQRARALNGLDVAIADDDTARMAREIARLERAGFDPAGALLHAILANNARLENGTTHAYAAAPDWLALASRTTSADKRLAAMIEPVAHLAWDVMGASEFPYATEARAWNESDFVAAVEREDEAVAIALMRGAISEAIPYSALRPALARAALSHYADFGHSAIYVLKTGQLIARLGGSVREPLLLALVRSLVQATREERLPEFRHYAKAAAAWHDGGTAAIAPSDLQMLAPQRALSRLVESARRPPRELFDVVLEAAGWNLLNFDTARDAATDNTIADNVGWLDFTHTLTFANAARHLCEESPELWPQALLQLGLFVARNVGYVAEINDAERWRVEDPAAFFASEMESLYDHGIVEPIVVCHRLKVLFALEDEFRAAPGAMWRTTMFAGVNRYLHTPMKRRHNLRLATQARDFVAREA